MTDVKKEFEALLLELVGDNVGAGCDCYGCEKNRQRMRDVVGRFSEPGLEEDNTNREPPNYREAECCGYCAKLAYKSKHCSLHNCTVEDAIIVCLALPAADEEKVVTI